MGCILLCLSRALDFCSCVCGGVSARKENKVHASRGHRLNVWLGGKGAASESLWCREPRIPYVNLFLALALLHYTGNQILPQLGH